MKVETKKKIRFQDIWVYLGLVVILLGFTVIAAATGRNFLSWANISNIIVQSSVIAVLAISASFVIITGGIDISIGTLAGFVGMVIAVCIRDGMAIVPACLVGIAVGTLRGAISGVGIAHGKLPPFVMTLGMNSVLGGMILLVSNSQPVSGLPNELALIAKTRIGPFPIFLLYVIVLYLVMNFVLRRTRFGRHVYSIGGNRQAARLSGVAVKRVEVITYAIGGFFAAIAGLMLLSRLQYASVTAGKSYEMQAIAASVIGGVSMSGGRGKLMNTLVGALILGIIKTGLQTMDLPTLYQEIATGLIIIFTVLMDKAEERKSE